MGGAARRGLVSLRAVSQSAQRLPWDSVWNASQGLSALIVAVLAIWAFFFSSLPEMLEKQLRTEVVSVNEELIEVRRNKARLEDDQAALKTANQALESQRTALSTQVSHLQDEATNASKQAEAAAQANRALTDKQAELTKTLTALELQRSTLTKEVEQLRSDRETYAKATGSSVAAKAAAMGLYELAMQHYLAGVCAHYDQHLKWLGVNKRYVQLNAEWEKQPSDQKWSDNNPMLKEVMRLQSLALDKPDIWLGEPLKPVLSPGNEQFVVSKHIATYLDIEDYKKLHQYLIGWLLDRTVKSRGVRPLTGRDLIDQMKAYEYLDQLLPEERDALRNTLDQFLVANPDLASLQINVVFDSEPKSDEIIKVGRKVLPDIERFQKAFEAYLTQRNVPLPVKQ